MKVGESNILFNLIVCKKIILASILSADLLPNKESNCQIELDIHFVDLQQLKDSHIIFQKALPLLRIMSFDIEIIPTKNISVDGRSTIVKIGNTLGYYGFRSKLENFIRKL